MKPRFEVADVLNAHWDSIATSPHREAIIAGSLELFMPSGVAEPWLWEGILINVPIAATCASAITVAVTAIFQSARECRRKNGSWQEKKNCFLCHTSMLCSHYQIPLTVCACMNPKMYDLLFATAWSVLEDFGHNHKQLGAQMGMIAILHTWGQNLMLHPHLHCIVAGGGLTKQNKWRCARNKGKFLFDVKAMSKVFSARFVAGVRE